MENMFIPIISIIFSGITSAFVANIYGRRNLKSSQYINVITSERIKWISNVSIVGGIFVGLTGYTNAAL